MNPRLAMGRGQIQKYVCRRVVGVSWTRPTQSPNSGAVVKDGRGGRISDITNSPPTSPHPALHSKGYTRAGLQRDSEGRSRGLPLGKILKVRASKRWHIVSGTFFDRSHPALPRRDQCNQSCIICVVD